MTTRSDRPGVGVAQVAVATVVGGIVGYVGGRWWHGRGGAMPAASWLTALVLLALAVVFVVIGRRIVATRAGTTTRPIHPLGAYRILLVAQASALTGAVVAGVYLAFGAVLLPDVDFPSVRTHAIGFGALAAAGATLAGAGLWVQHVCRIDRGDGDPGRVDRVEDAGAGEGGNPGRPDSTAPDGL